MIKINRNLPLGRYPIKQVFSGLENTEILTSVFGTENKKYSVLSTTEVIIEDQPGYMYVKNESPTIVVGKNHLSTSDEKILYLDVIHELVHVKQQKEGKDLYDRSYSYVDRPTEVEAYRFTVKEAKRIGLTNEEILDYLDVGWISQDEHRRLAAKLLHI